MKKKQAQDLLDRFFDPMRHTLGIGHYQLNLALKRLGLADSGAVGGMVARRLNYHSADIYLDPENLENPEAFLRTLRHEMIHVLLADFDHFKAMALTAAPEGLAREMLETTWTHASELTVLNIERMLDYHHPYQPWKELEEKSEQGIDTQD